MDQITPILTERLELRLLTSDDAGAVHRFRGHHGATLYLSHDALSPEENRARLVELVKHAEASTPEWFHFGWAVVLRATGELIGDCRTWNTSEPPLPGKIPSDYSSLGYVLHPDQHGKGYGREAAAAMLHWLFSNRDIRTVYAGVYEPNTASRNLLESLGFAQDHFFPLGQGSGGKGLPAWRYRLDRPTRIS
ncbi:GNAT family N-acetyltransferase [Micrococcaceae bacterium Sec5.7]